MDRRAKKAFEDEHKGPNKFAGKRAEHRTQEELRWRVPHGIQWVEWREETRDAVWDERLALLHQGCRQAHGVDSAEKAKGRCE
jgi:hypothetical protein